jgi:hypothetical protein
MRPASIVISHNMQTLRNRGFVANLEPPDWEQYTHEIRDIGGLWAASFNLVRPRDELIEMFENGLDREVMVTSRSGAAIWEGYIDEMALQIRGVELRKSLTRMANSVWVRYASGGVSGIRGTVYTDAASVAKYGIKQRPFSGGQAVSGGQADQAAQVLLSRLKSPDNPSMRWAGGGDKEQTTLAIRCKGWWQKLYWQVYNQTVLTGSAAAYAIIGRMLDALESTAVVNYALNPSFEVNVTDDWILTGVGGNATRDTTEYKVGAASCRLDCGAVACKIVANAGVSVPNNVTVSGRVWVKCEADPTGDKARFDLVETGVAIRAGVSATIASNGAWELITCSWTNTTGGASVIQVYLRNVFNDSATSVWYDACQLELGGPASLYTDGTLPNCGWSGTAHNSTSWRKTLGFVRSRAIQVNDTMTQEKYDADMWPADIMKGIAAVGDYMLNKWIVGMRVNKTLYYEPAASSKPA